MSRQVASPQGPCSTAIVTPIVQQEQVAEQTFRVRLACPEIASRARPGQFVMVRLAGRNDPLLARPFAVYDTFPGESDSPEIIDLVYTVHGRFTQALSREPAGTPLLVWGPLGNGFSPPPVAHLILVAGGIGQTALLALGKERRGVARYGRGNEQAMTASRVSLLWGARTATAFNGVADFEHAGITTHLVTDDGSAGLRGTVVDLLETQAQADPSDFSRAEAAVACCGPEPMMEAVAAWCGRRGISCQVSLETPMACGIGICFSCVAAVRDANGAWDYRRTCVEGPVFEASSIVWHPSGAEA
jgi:dihydroorotate dehydrogenase electron transfer subunit